MKVLKIMLTLFVLTLNSAFAATPPFKTSFYTEIKSEFCLTTSSNIWDGEPGDYFTAECPGFGGYRVIQKGGDARSWYELRYGATAIDLYDAMIGPGAIGGFPAIKATKFEWRVEVGTAQARVYGAIFRVVAQDLVTFNDFTRLYVLRLNAGFGCVIGVATTNAQAVAMVDDLTRPCM